MKPIQEINPELFLSELYDTYLLLAFNSWELPIYAVGYCDASKLCVKPKSDDVALMFELPIGNKLWCYTSKKMLDDLNSRRESGRGIPQWAYEEAEKQNH